MNGNSLPEPGQCLDELGAACGGRAKPAAEVDSVAGVAARYVASPRSTDEVSGLLRVAARHQLRLVARGGATKLDWGPPPTGVDLIVDMAGVAGIVEHAAGDLVVVARAGTRYDDLQAAVAEAGQQLALDGPVAGATLGGMVATNTSGPRRLLYGTARDLVIGVRFVRADGVAAKAGGKVVKNVAGYDFGKLLTGSYGTLAVLTELAFRLHPLPAARCWVTVEAASPDDAGSALAAVLASQVVPTAIEVDQQPDGPVTVAVLLEGTAAGVEGRARSVAALVGGGRVAEQPPVWFGGYPFEAGESGLKITTVLSGVAPVLVAVRESAQRHGARVGVRGSAAGVLYAGLAADTPPEIVGEVVAELRASAGALGGGVVVLTAPAAVRAAVDLWGPVPGLDLMRRVKDEFDPEHRLAPGRFVGGI